MTKRFRMVAGPNGSGKSTLVARLVEDYAVNFYTRLNADEVFAQVKRTGAFFAPFPIDGQTLSAYVSGTQYADVEKARFFSGEISVEFSHPSKVSALEKANAAGFRTYLYYVATDDPEINADRVARRYSQGGHDVPREKIRSRYARSLENIPAAMPYLSRAYFFDNSGERMRYLASFSREEGMNLLVPASDLPRWFCNCHFF